MSTPKPITFAVAGIAAVALAFGAYAVGNSNSASGTSNAAAFGRAGQPPGAGSAGTGSLPGNGQAPPGFGAPATGAAADKAKAAALAKYKGTVERVMKLSDGSYQVHVLTSGGGEYHVAVSKDFRVTGAQHGGPGGPGGAPRSLPGSAAPSTPGTTN